MAENTALSLNATDNSCILISFCNQLSSPKHSLCILDPTKEDSQWIELSAIPEALRQDFSGITGSCRVGEEIIIVTQSATPALACVSINEAKVTNHIALEKSRDPHSLVFHTGYIYLVSTGTNEIYRVPFHNGQFGREELFWGYPGVSYNKDEVHLNGLTIDKDRLIASCFGPKRTDGSWGAKGRVFYVDSGHTIHESLNQPHSPTVHGYRLAFAESAAHKIHIYIKDEHDEWMVDKEIDLSGYARGVAVKGSNLWVGISADRKISRSQHKFLNDGQQESSDSALVEIDIKTGVQSKKLTLLGFGREVYDLVELRTYSAMLPLHDSILTRVRAIESSVDRYKADLSGLFLENIAINKQLHATQIDMELGLQVAKNEMEYHLQVAQDELELLHHTLSWRITVPLRSFRRLWSRLSSDKQSIKKS